jgi:hypothetical protein
MGGYCGIASRFLISLAQRNHIYGMRLVCGLFNTTTHCWVEYEGFCIDTTISQFSGFEDLKYKVCRVKDDFYNTYYYPHLIGTKAARHQRRWELGQAYESYSSLLWKIHKKRYIKEYNGILFR